MRRFSRNYSISSNPVTVDLLEHNYTCHRAGDDTVIGSCLFVSEPGTLTRELADRANAIIVSSLVALDEDDAGLIKSLIDNGSDVYYFDPNEGEEVPDGYKVAYMGPADPEDWPAYKFTGDMIIIQNIALAEEVIYLGTIGMTEEQLSAWTAVIANNTFKVAIETSGVTPVEDTMHCLMLGADFAFTQTPLIVTEQFDLFIGTKVKAVDVDGDIRAAITDSHTVIYDVVTKSIKARGNISRISDHFVESDDDVQIMVKTADTLDDLAKAQPFAYTSHESTLGRYVQLTTQNITLIRFCWELSEEANLVQSIAVHGLTNYLPEWMEWRTDPRSNGSRIMQSFAQITDEIREASTEVRMIPTDMPISIMNGVGHEDYVGDEDNAKDGYIDVVVHSLENFAQANSSEELLYSPVPAYVYIDGYLVLVHASDGNPINLWTPLDEWGAYIGMTRHDQETLKRFRLRVLDSFRSEHGPHREAFIKTVVRELMPPSDIDPDEFDDPGEVVGVVALNDPELFTSDNFPLPVIETAVKAQRIAGQHVYDDGTVGRALWNANGPDNEGGARLPYRYDTDMTQFDDMDICGAGPGEDLKVSIGQRGPISAQLQVKKVQINSDAGAAGVNPVTILVGVKKTGSYNEFITPMMHSVVRCSLRVEALNVTATRDIIVEGNSSKNIVNAEGNMNVYQVNLVDPDTGMLEGSWSYVSGEETKTLTSEELSLAWDAATCGPISAEAGTLFKVEIFETTRLDTEEVVASGATVAVGGTDVFAATIELLANESGLTCFDLKFKDDLGTEPFAWSSETYEYELHRNHDLVDGDYVTSGDTVEIDAISVPGHVDNVTTIVTVIGITADLNSSVALDPTKVTASITDGVLSTSVPTPSDIHYPVKTYSRAVSVSDTIDITDLVPGESREYVLAAKEMDTDYFVVPNPQLSVSYNSSTHSITVSRAEEGSVLVNPGWFWIGKDERYFYTGVEGWPVSGLEFDLAGRTILPESKITVDGYKHRYNIDGGQKTFVVTQEIVSHGGNVFIDDSDVELISVTKNGAPVIDCVVNENEVTVTGGTAAGDIVVVSYRLQNSFYVDWAADKIIFSDEVVDRSVKIQADLTPFASVVTIDPHKSVLDKYFIVLDGDTAQPATRFEISCDSVNVPHGSPVCLKIEAFRADDTPATGVTYNLLVTGATMADTGVRQIWNDGFDIVEIWPDSNATEITAQVVEVESGVAVERSVPAVSQDLQSVGWTPSGITNEWDYPTTSKNHLKFSTLGSFSLNGNVGSIMFQAIGNALTLFAGEDIFEHYGAPLRSFDIAFDSGTYTVKMNDAVVRTIETSDVDVSMSFFDYTPGEITAVGVTQYITVESTVGELTLNLFDENAGNLPTERIVFDNPSSMRLGFAMNVNVRSWESPGVPTSGVQGSWTLTRFELDEAGNAAGTQYQAVSAGTVNIDVRGRGTIALPGADLSKRGSYKLSVTIDGKTAITTWRIY